jgi:hypothetical protein
VARSQWPLGARATSRGLRSLTIPMARRRAHTMRQCSSDPFSPRWAVPHPSWLDKRRDQPIPSPRNRERSGEQRNAATLQWRGWAGRLRTSHEWRQGRAMRERADPGQSLLSDPSCRGGFPRPSLSRFYCLLPGERARHGCRRARAVPPTSLKSASIKGANSLTGAL